MFNKFTIYTQTHTHRHIRTHHIFWSKASHCYWTYFISYDTFFYRLTLFFFFCLKTSKYCLYIIGVPFKEKFMIFSKLSFIHLCCFFFRLFHSCIIKVSGTNPFFLSHNQKKFFFSLNITFFMRYELYLMSSMRDV